MDPIEQDIKEFIAAERTARELFKRSSEADREAVPAELLASVRSRIPQKESLACPYCRKPITPFKKPLSRQKLWNLLWLAAGLGFFGTSFVFKRYFVQWVALGALCITKWIVDQKATKTQIMIYKALSEDTQDKTRHLHRIDSNL